MVISSWFSKTPNQQSYFKKYLHKYVELIVVEAALSLS